MTTPVGPLTLGDLAAVLAVAPLIEPTRLDVRPSFYEVMRSQWPAKPSREVPRTSLMGMDVYIVDDLPVAWRIVRRDGTVQAQAVA